jgi:hypothetical protein
MLIKQVLDFIHNYFVKNEYCGSFKIEDGSLVSDKLINGQYFMIKGSLLNDGVYQYPATNLLDEEFKGKVYGLAIPRDVLDLISEIDEWQTKNKNALESPYQSESFGGYSYSKATSGKADGSQLTWRDVFGSRLNAYRKLS